MDGMSLCHVIVSLCRCVVVLLCRCWYSFALDCLTYSYFYHAYFIIMVVVVSFIQSVIRYYTIQYVNIHRHACEQSSIIIILYYYIYYYYMIYMYVC